MLDQYLHKHINGYGPWDWDWMIQEHGADSLRWALGSSAKRRHVVPMTGKFTTVEASQYHSTAGPAIPLTDDELSQPSNLRQKRSVVRNVGGTVLKKVDEQNYDWENRVSNVRLTLENRLQQ